MRLGRSLASAFLAVVVGVAGVIAVAASPAGAVTTSLSDPSPFTGSDTLSSLQITASSVLGVTTTATLDTTLDWTQPAAVGTAFDPNLVRQGRALDPSDSYTRTAGGSMAVTWTLKNVEVSWDSIGPVNIGSVGMTANGPCDLVAGGADHVCHLESDQISIFDTSPLAGPYIKAKLKADVTVTPAGISTLRSVAFGGNPGGTNNLSLGESPITDPLAIPCTVGGGDEMQYTLGSMSSTQGISVATSLELEVGVSIPNPFFPIPDPVDPVIYLPAFASPSYPLGTVNNSVAMTTPDAVYDLGVVQANNIPPVVNVAARTRATKVPRSCSTARPVRACAGSRRCGGTSPTEALPSAPTRSTRSPTTACTRACSPRPIRPDCRTRRRSRSTSPTCRRW